MKANFVCFKLSKVVAILVLIILLQLVFIVIGIKEIRETTNFEQIQNDVEKISKTNETTKNGIIKNTIENQSKEEGTLNTIKDESNEDMSSNIVEQQEIKNVEEYKDMPREIKGFKVIGKIEIPKLKLNSYILAETSTKSLKVSVTKLYGPGINEIGNFCIAGHNYRNNKMFGGIKKLEQGDEIILTDTYGRNVMYKVYKNYQTDPKNVECLKQDTGGEREVTLITCTARSN